MSESDLDAGEYVVEKILRMRSRGPKRFFLLKWEGYDEPTWEPEENLNCPELIQEFKEKCAGRKRWGVSNSSSGELPSGTLAEGAIKSDGFLKPLPKVRARKRRRSSSRESECSVPLPVLDQLPFDSFGTDATSEEDKENNQPQRGSATMQRSKVGKATGLRGFDRNLPVDRIMGAAMISDELTFAIKWKGLPVADLVPAKIANVKAPQSVIKFYEERLKWVPSDD